MAAVGTSTLVGVLLLYLTVALILLQPVMPAVTLDKSTYTYHAPKLWYVCLPLLIPAFGFLGQVFLRGGGAGRCSACSHSGPAFGSACRCWGYFRTLNPPLLPPSGPH